MLLLHHSWTCGVHGCQAGGATAGLGVLLPGWGCYYQAGGATARLGVLHHSRHVVCMGAEAKTKA